MYVSRGGKVFQRQTAINLEHKNIFIFFIVKNNVVGWVCQPLEVIQVATQFFEELKTTILFYKLSLYKNRNVALEAIQSSPILFFINPKTSPIYLKRLVDIFKDLELGKEHPS